jgi:hypothetical protein
MHGTGAEWRLLTQQRGQEAGSGRRGDFVLFRLGPARVQGRPTPRGRGRS